MAKFKVSAAVAVAATVLVGLGVAFAGDGPARPGDRGAPAEPFQPGGRPAPAPPAAPDRRPPMVYIRWTVLVVPAGFVEEVGLAAGNEKAVPLTAREAALLDAVVRRTKGVEVVARPRVAVRDGQTGHFQVGDAGARGLTGRVTPRVSADGGLVVLRHELQVSAPAAGGLQGAPDVESARVSGAVPPGRTLVVRGPRSNPFGERAGELLVLATVERVDPDAGR